jgi:hypothetical protein
MQLFQRFRHKKILFLVAIIFVASFGPALPVKAFSQGDSLYFNVDPNYDSTARTQVQATLVKTTASLYFYVETAWWAAQTSSQQNQILNSLDALSNEFDSNIYPTLTSAYGSEFRPGIDNDTRITILFETINSGLGGYFRSDDEYSKLQIPDSNEREMLYMPIDQITSPQLKVFLGHEFVHLIVFNQKDRLQGVQEEVWLSEARSDYASTLLGYDDIYEGSNLQRRVNDFLGNPNDSLPEWLGTKYDYATEDLFTHYLVDHYGIGILGDSLKSKLVGIPSINEALLKHGYKEDFSQIFTDWTIALSINDCSQNPNYCYINKNLTALKINPTLIFLPLTGNSSLSMNNVTKNWAGNWEKIVGGNGDLTLQFSSFSGLNFQVPYIVYDKNNNYTVKFLLLDNQSKGSVTIKDFGTKYNALVVIPLLQTKMTGFNGAELSYPYTFTISVTQPTSQADAALLQKLQDQLNALKNQNATAPSCTQLQHNLYFGVSYQSDVRCLQQFLKLQGPDIYPSGLVTGNFGLLTKAAVLRFQNKYKAEVLAPLGLSQGTGFVGALTRLKINQLLQK